MKRILSAILIGVMSISMLTVNASAHNNTQGMVVVKDVGGATKISSLSISSSTAYCDSTYSDDNKSIKSIRGEQTLEKKTASGSYSAVSGARWIESSSSADLSMFHTKSGLSKGTYRLKTVFKATFNNGKTETTTVYSLLSTIR